MAHDAEGPDPVPAYPPLAGAILDLDGTLVDSEPLYAESDETFLSSYGIELGANGKTRFVGIGTRDMFLALESEYPGNPLNDLPLEERIARKDEAFMALARGRLRAFPAVLGLALELGKRRLRLALASGSSPAVIDFAISAIGARGLFSALVSTAELPRGKPDPAVFLEAAKRLALESGACVVFEDSVHGLAAAKAAGMRCIALPAPGCEGPAFAAADLQIKGGAAAVDGARLLMLLESWG